MMAGLQLSSLPMEKYLSPTFYWADFTSEQAGTTKAFIASTAREAGFREDWLQTAIAANPELVIAPCREAGFTVESWVVWGREISVNQAGTMDIVLVSESGRIAIVETKLSYNPGSRRSVVAQVLEYAIHFPDVDISELPEEPQLEGQPFTDIEMIHSRILEGDYLLIIAGDQLDSRAVKLAKSVLGRHMVNSWTLAMVEIGVFRSISETATEHHLLVPHLRGAIVPEIRQIVKIAVEGDKRRLLVESPSQAAAAVDMHEVYIWTRGRFEQDVLISVPQYAQVVMELIRLSEDLGTLQWKSGDLQGRHGKLNITFPSLGNLPFLRLWSEDGTLQIERRPRNKTEPAATRRKTAFQNLVLENFCPAPGPDDVDYLVVDAAHWSGKVDVFQRIVKQFAT